MLDDKDLQAIDKLIAARINVMVENEITPKFNMLADMILEMKEEISGNKTTARLDDAEERLDVHEAVIRRHSADIEKLKKAQ